MQCRIIMTITLAEGSLLLWDLLSNVPGIHCGLFWNIISVHLRDRFSKAQLRRSFAQASLSLCTFFASSLSHCLVFCFLRWCRKQGCACLLHFISRTLSHHRKHIRTQTNSSTHTHAKICLYTRKYFTRKYFCGH